MQRCSHPNIGRLSAIAGFYHDGIEYLLSAEEFLSGGTLTARLRRGLLRMDELRRFGTQLVSAVAHIASHDLVHRDIKPDNILFRIDDITPVIIDFGLVRDLVGTSLTQTWLMRGPGTPLFAPAEQLRNEQTLIDWRSDQFSLGVVIALRCLSIGTRSHRLPTGDGPADCATGLRSFPKGIGGGKAGQISTRFRPRPPRSRARVSPKLDNLFMRGRLPKPNAQRIREGMRGHRPLRNEPNHAAGSPTRPKGMSAAAARIWNRLVETMDPLILRQTDQDALMALCEDEALLAQSYSGLWKMAKAIEKKAAAEGRPLVAGPVAALLTLPQGRFALAAIRDVAHRLIIERREFGLSPSARCRLDAGSVANIEDALDDAIFNQKSQLFVLPKSP
jgi:serine/threonine protein kinase